PAPVAAPAPAAPAAPVAAPAPAAPAGDATPVLLPALGESVTEGTVTIWLNANGEKDGRVGQEVAVDSSSLWSQKP
ncbi:hypothetical protein PUR71_00240, partial [Streptomyces sp. SP17BM10]|nr:hypothetical protein [Streptomyces sp. SP17BM10]